MKILTCNFASSGKRQIIVALTTMHIVNTAAGNGKTHKKLSLLVPREWQKLEDPHFSIRYPSSWSLDKSGRMGLSFIIYAQSQKHPDPFRENINLLIQDLSGKNMGLDQFVKLSENQIKTQITNGVILESKRIIRSNDEFHKIFYKGNSGDNKLKFLQCYWIRNEKAYILTLTCEMNEFDKFKPTAEKIMDSFKPL